MTPNRGSLDTQASQVCADLAAQDAAWAGSSWTRRRFIAGAGMVGAAALASQLVTTRVAYGAAPRAPGAGDDRTLILIFLRGGADALRILVPNNAELGLNFLRQVRLDLIPTPDQLQALENGWALNAALAPLYDALWSTGELAFVPAVSSKGVSRSHFQAQQYLERGGSDSGSTGWLDRALAALGTGTTFRALAMGDTAPLSLLGGEPSLAISRLQDFSFPGWDDDMVRRSESAIKQLYRGLQSPLGEDVPNMLAALSTAAKAQADAGAPQNGADYPDNDLSSALKDLATILRADVGAQVATIDVGGWDTHTDEAGDLDANLGDLAASLAAFMTDLGPDRRSRVTVAVQTEFGRRVEMNASGGTDHGHGSVLWLLGGGLNRSGVFGKWDELNDTTVTSGDADGDVPGLNSPFAVLAELLGARLGAGSLSSVFPGQDLTPLQIFTQ